MTALTYIFIFITGTAVGSFLNVLIMRIPKGESIAFPASHCVHCNTPLKIWHNIPIFSWLFLRGKCAFCGVRISYQYPLIELLSGVIFIVIFAKMGIVLATLGIALAFLLLLTLSVIDFYYKSDQTEPEIGGAFLSLMRTLIKSEILFFVPMRSNIFIVARQRMRNLRVLL